MFSEGAREASLAHELFMNKNTGGTLLCLFLQPSGDGASSAQDLTSHSIRSRLASVHNPRGCSCKYSLAIAARLKSKLLIKM